MANASSTIDFLAKIKTLKDPTEIKTKAIDDENHEEEERRVNFFLLSKNIYDILIWSTSGTKITIYLGPAGSYVYW